MRIPGSNLIECEKYIFLFILLNKMHITFYQKQSHGEHDILAFLHFSCAISWDFPASKKRFSKTFWRLTLVLQGANSRFMYILR